MSRITQKQIDAVLKEAAEVLEDLGQYDLAHNDAVLVGYLAAKVARQQEHIELCESIIDNRKVEARLS